MILANRFNYPDGFQEKCGAILDMAFEHVPVYREWKRFDPGARACADERFDALPALAKADIRDNFPLGLMPDWKNLGEGLENEAIGYTFTSGTTSEKVVNIWDQCWWDRSEAASWKLNRHTAALSYPQKQAKLASSLNVGINCEDDLPMTHRLIGHTLYLNEKTSVLQWQPRHLKRMVDELNIFKPVILEANPSLLARLAYWAIDNGAAVFSPQVIVFTFEFSSAIHLEAIRQVFSSVFISSYGTTETGFVMEQCESGLMHQNTEFCRIDFEPLKPEYGDPELGRILVTTFDNPWNCVIRFDVGDLVRLHPKGTCDCGLSEGMIAGAIEGRAGNITFRTDGGIVTTKALDDSLAAVDTARDYHLEQCDSAGYLLEATLSPGADQKKARDAFHAALENVYGKDGSFDIRIAADILPGPAGKYRRTQTNLIFDESGLFR